MRGTGMKGMKVTNGKSTKLFNQAMDAMRKPGSRLIQTNYRGGPDFWIAPSGVRIEPGLARRIMDHPQVIGEKDALFPGHHQTWRIRSGDDA